MSYKTNIVVVGSGPAAYASCIALKDLGIKPTVVFFEFAKPYWSRNKLNYQKEKVTKDKFANHVTRKHRNNDQSMYEIHPSSKIKNISNLALPISFYPGGFSSVWGANIATLGGNELKKWGSEEILQKQAYLRILREINYVSGDDALNVRFPLQFKQEHKTYTCEAFANLIENFQSKDILIGRARNASASSTSGCVLCGKCLIGCPEDVIFDSSKYLREMVMNEEIDVIDGIITELSHIGEKNFQLKIDKCQDYDEINAENVILACGSISTITLLQSSNLVPELVTLDDSQVVYLPILSIKRNNRAAAKYSLAQVFICSSNIDEDFHLSLYESDNMLKQRIILITNFFSRLIPKFLLHFVYPGILFLPSSVSGKVIIKKEKEGSTISIKNNTKTEKYKEKIISQLKKELGKYGFFVIKRFQKVGTVGSSYHVGTARDTQNNSIFDIDGRIKNMKSKDNLIITDAGSLPYLQTGPITLSIMANSYRMTRKTFE
jgi:ferredoxin